MSKNNKRIDFIREKTADRLNEIMEKRNKGGAQLLRDSGALMSEPNLSQIRKKKRTLQREDAILFSKALRVDPGYLLGVDEYKAASYNEYVQIMKDDEEYAADVKAIHKYDDIINLIGGYTLVAGSITDTSADYTYLGDNVSGKNENNVSVRRNGIVAVIPASEMDKFESEVLMFIKKRFDSLMMLYRDEEEEERAKADPYSFIHSSRR